MNVKPPTILFIDDGLRYDEGAGHGALVYDVFKKYVNVDYKVKSIKILNENGTGSPKALVDALHSEDAQTADVINLSIGTQQFSDFAIIANAIKALPHAIIIAACANTHRLTFPACLPQVIGVRAFPAQFTGDLPQQDIICVSDPWDSINVYVKNMYANSVAAPVVSAKVCNLLAEGIAKTDVYIELQKRSGLFTPDTPFYQSMLMQWEVVSIPIISWPHELPTPKSLLRDFIKNSYRALYITTVEESDIENFVINLHQHPIILHYNFTHPDIIFLHGIQDGGYTPDLIFTCEQANITLHDIETLLK